MNFTMIIAILLASGPLSETEPRPVDERSHSYWGPMPHPTEADSRRALSGQRMPLWEMPFWAAWQVPKYTLGTAAHGLAWSVGRAWEQRIPQALYDAVSLDFLPIQGSLSLRAGGGTGVAGRYQLLQPTFAGGPHQLRVALEYSVDRNAQTTAGLRFFEGHTHTLEAGAGYQIRRDARFFGVGPDSREVDESFFTAEDAWAGMTLRRRWGRELSTSVDASWSRASSRGPRDDDPSLESVFDSGERPAGYGDRSEGYTLGLGIVHDSTKHRGRPESGGTRRLKASYFRDIDSSDLGFVTWRAEAEQFVPLWFTRRALAMRATASWMNPSGDGPVPFERLLTNDERDQFRGFKDERWRDEGILLVGAEYRWPIWNTTTIDDTGLDAYAFLEAGQVFADADQISLHNLQEAYGGGVRLITTPDFQARFEIGRSDEETVFRLSVAQTFQHAERGAFHGVHPIPER